MESFSVHTALQIICHANLAKWKTNLKECLNLWTFDQIFEQQVGNIRPKNENRFESAIILNLFLSVFKTCGFCCILVFKAFKMVWGKIFG